MKSFEQLAHEAKPPPGAEMHVEKSTTSPDSATKCIWRQAVIEAHQLLLEQAMLEDLVCYSGTEAFRRIAWDLHIALDIELTAAGELLLPISQSVYRRAQGE